MGGQQRHCIPALSVSGVGGARHVLCRHMLAVRAGEEAWSSAERHGTQRAMGTSERQWRNVYDDGYDVRSVAAGLQRVAGGTAPMDTPPAPSTHTRLGAGAAGAAAGRAQVATVARPSPGAAGAAAAEGAQQQRRGSRAIAREHCVSRERAESMTTNELKETWLQIYGRRTTTANKVYLQRAVTYPGTTPRRERPKKAASLTAALHSPVAAAALSEEAVCSEEEVDTSCSEEEAGAAQWEDEWELDGPSATSSEALESGDETEEERSPSCTPEVEVRRTFTVRLNSHLPLLPGGKRAALPMDSDSPPALAAMVAIDGIDVEALPPLQQQQTVAVVEVSSSEEGTTEADEKELTSAVTRFKRRKSSRAAKRLRVLLATTP